MSDECQYCDCEPARPAPGGCHKVNNPGLICEDCCLGCFCEDSPWFLDWFKPPNPQELPEGMVAT